MDALLLLRKAAVLGIWSIAIGAAPVAGFAGEIRTEVATLHATRGVLLQTERRTAPRDGATECNFRQDPASPISPPGPGGLFTPGFGTEDVYGVEIDVANGVTFYGIVDIGITCVEAKRTISWEEFWTNAQSQDILRRAKVISIRPPGATSNTSRETGRLGIVDNSLFIVARAPSRINNDSALFIAAARSAVKPQRLNWQLFRIQLTHVANGSHFCTPSATATVLDPVIGVSPRGRLFVAFTSFEGSTTTGSILDFDARSLLRGGPVEVKCFTGTELKNLVPPDMRDDSRNAYFLSVSTLASVTRFKLKVTNAVANDTLVSTPDINIPFFDFNPAAVQPNGFHLYSGGFNFQTPSIQSGQALWNVHQIGDDVGHEKVRLYKLGTVATDPEMTLTLGTLPDRTDDTFAPSVEIDSAAPDGEAFVTFTRTIAADPVNGKATLMMARGPNSSPDGWTSTVLAVSKGQFSKNLFGGACDPFIYAGCNYGPVSATAIDPIANAVWGFGELITNGDLGTGGRGNEVNWLIKGIGVPKD